MRACLQIAAPAYTGCRPAIPRPRCQIKGRCRGSHRQMCVGPPAPKQLLLHAACHILLSLLLAQQSATVIYCCPGREYVKGVVPAVCPRKSAARLGRDHHAPYNLDSKPARCYLQGTGGLPQGAHESDTFHRCSLKLQTALLAPQAGRHSSVAALTVNWHSNLRLLAI